MSNELQPKPNPVEEQMHLVLDWALQPVSSVISWPNTARRLAVTASAVGLVGPGVGPINVTSMHVDMLGVPPWF